MRKGRAKSETATVAPPRTALALPSAAQATVTGSAATGTLGMIAALRVEGASSQDVATFGFTISTKLCLRLFSVAFVNLFFYFCHSGLTSTYSFTFPTKKVIPGVPGKANVK